MRKRASLFIVVCMQLLVLSACSGSKATTQTADKPVEIHIFAQQDAAQDLRGNDFSKLLEHKFNVKFDWNTIPYDGAKEKRQISLASGNYADTYILTEYIDQFSQADVLRYGKKGVFIPLNDLIARYAPHIQAAFKKDPKLKAINTAADGHIYGLTAYSECFHCSYPNKMWINTEWLKKLKLTMPQTTGDFKKVLQAFKNQDPNGNGLADEVPLSGSTEDYGVHLIPYLMNGFIYDDDDRYLVINQGKVELAANKPEWKEGLAYIKSLYDEQLIDPGAFVQNADVFKKIGENADAEILGAGAAMHPEIFVNTGPGNERGSHYNPVPPLRGPHAAYALHKEIGVMPGAKFVITDKASPEAQAALIKMVDYMYTPQGQVLAEVGKEGVAWRKPVKGEEALNKEVAPAFTSIPAKEGDTLGSTGWSGMGHFYMPKAYRDSWVQSTDIYSPGGYERRLYDATLLYAGKEPKEMFPTWVNWIDKSKADEANMLQTNIKNYVNQNALQFITGNKDLNKDWDAYIKGLNELQVNRYVAIMQKAYNATMSNKAWP
ncbi:ABC transporter substrate-binding protein [Paenibacillus solisilvae]|uniref:ABC transporter substrate-binding protein n=1 Tax=Paenibacillus solisilvae TaxID=2486751 RepID=A0ABW0W643_9BACL